jgi:hypothetical protein
VWFCASNDAQASECRLSLRERTFFRGAKDDNQLMVVFAGGVIVAASNRLINALSRLQLE